uniref:Uncharacterized protein n=1 Tax=Panagrolaimus superbus TaxID=310955 RepID=A0A914Y8I9_9BILA
MKPQQQSNNADKNFNETCLEIDDKYSLLEKYYSEASRLTNDEEMLQKRIQELEKYKYKAKLSIEKAEREKRIEKKRADAAEKEVQELHFHIIELNALQKEKDVQFADYKNAAEYNISKSDYEKEYAYQWIDNTQNELIKFQTTVNYLQRELEEEREKAVKEEQNWEEEIKGSLQIQCQRLGESLKAVEEKNDKLDLEAMKCRKTVANVEEQLNEIYENI